MIHNPVLRKELLMRFRIRHARATQVGFVVVVGLLIGVFYYFSLQTLLTTSEPRIAATIWGGSIMFQYLLVCILAPSLTANSITQEREQQTWEMLVFTRLSAFEILTGKLLARLTSVALLLAVFLPITLLSWVHVTFIGTPATDISIPFSEFCMAYLVIIVTTVFYATLSLYLSLRMKRTLYAVITAYVFVVGILLIGTFMATLVLSYGMSGTGSYEFTMRSPFLWFNPIRLMLAVFDTKEPNSVIALIGGLFGYCMGTVFMLSHAIVAFRRFAEAGS